MTEIEQIGKVKLDYSNYPGEDLYCDGVVEDEILDIVKNMSPLEYQREIEKRKSWPILYHLSQARENIADWLPIQKTEKVLEVGSGCGAITGAFARKAGSVTCVDLSKKRSRINAYRHMECDNVTIKVGNFKDIEPELPRDYDYVCLIGVFEYAQSYIGGETAFEDFLKILQKHLSPKGRIIIAIENKLGMKYFAGCKEDHLGTYFSGIENYPEGGVARTFSRNGLEKLFTSCKMEQRSFYYPYPDYKFMTTLYSDEHLPGKGELSNNYRNFDRDRMLLFDEKSAFDSVVADDYFSVFSNSYLVVLGKPFDIEYARYSNDRAPEFAIKTLIQKNAAGEKEVRKYPFRPEAKEHVRNMQEAYRKLSEKYQGGSLQINHCELVELGEECYAKFEYVTGTPLSEKLDTLLEQGNVDGFHQLFQTYVEKTGYHQEYEVSDFDLIFSNILVDGDRWTLIDYEWTFEKQMEQKELAFRAVYCYLLEDERRKKLSVDRILEELHITLEEVEIFREREIAFQKYVTGKRLSMAQMREVIGYRMMKPQKWIEQHQDSEAVNRVQIYEDKGKGFSEEESYFVREAYLGENKIELELKVSGDVKTLRVDPAFSSCIVKIEEMTFNQEPVPFEKKKVLLINGRIAKPATLIFPTEDPNIHIILEELNRLPENDFYLRMEIVRVPVSMAQELAGAVKKIF